MVPSDYAAEVMRTELLKCPECGVSIRVFEDEVGEAGACPGCSVELRVSPELFTSENEEPEQISAAEDLPFEAIDELELGQATSWEPEQASQLEGQDQELGLELEELAPLAGHPTPAEPAEPPPAEDTRSSELAEEPAYEVPEELRLAQVGTRRNEEPIWLGEKDLLPEQPPSAGQAPAGGPRPNRSRAAGGPKRGMPKSSRRRRRKGTAPQWAEGFAGAFAYAYYAAAAGDGWKALLRYALIGAAFPMAVFYLRSVPMLTWAVAIGLFCFLFYAVDVRFVVTFGFVLVPLALLASVTSVLMVAAAVGAPAGALHYYMVQAGAHGAGQLVAARPGWVEDVIEPGIQVFLTIIAALAIPLLVGTSAGRLIGGPDLWDYLGALARGARTQGLLDSPALLAQAAIAGGAGLFSFFCFPMVAVLLAATNSVMRSLNPLVVIPRMFHGPLEYAAVWAFCCANVVLAGTLFVLVIHFQGGLGRPGWVISFLLVEAVACYFAATCGWRMGIFLRRHPSIIGTLE